MNFPLQQLERYIDEAFLVEGEQLFEQGHLERLKEIDRHLWVAVVATLEVEVKLSPSKVMACSCDCADFGAHRMCAHVAALLLALRRRLSELERPKKVEVSGKQRLTTARILKTADHTDLVLFLRAYANKDRNFALALKARFAGTVEFSDDKLKYLQLLEETIRASRKKDRLISYRGGQKLLKIVEELALQADQAVVQAYFSTAVLIAESLIERLTPILKKLPEQLEEPFRAQLEGSFRLLDRILGLQPAPALLEELWTYCAQECRKITYRINDIAPLFYGLLLELAERLQLNQELNTLLDTLLELPRFSMTSHTKLLVSKLTVLERLEDFEAIEQLTHTHLGHPELLLRAVQQAIARGYWSQAKQLAETANQRTLPVDIKGKIEDLLLQIALEERDKESIVRYAFARLISTRDFRYFEVFKSNSPKWETSYQTLVTASLKMKQLDRLHFLAELYAKEEQYKSLLDLIETQRALRILELFDTQLLPEHKKAVYRLYEILLSDYLMHHLGRKPANTVRQKLAHLHSIGASDLAKKLVKQFRLTYADRPSLMDELAIF